MARARPPAKASRSKTPAAKTDRPSTLPAGYGPFLEALKARIGQAQTRAAHAVSRELLTLYWQTGSDLVARQERESWGSAVIERLAADLGRALPGVEGFSARNLWRMRAFYLAYRDEKEFLPPAVAEMGQGEILPPAVADLPWAHHVILIEKVKDPAVRGWYVRAALAHGWSRNMLGHHIDAGLHLRQGKAPNNFDRTLPPLQSDLAAEVLKDPYNFDFLTIGAEAHERDLERGLVAHVRDFLVELGVGFAFVGSQVHLEVEGDDFYLDLLFYHLKLRCYVVIDLKMKEFKPEFAGKMNFYLSAVDAQLRHPSDQPTIGLILCKQKKRLVVEYALKDLSKPIGVSAYQLTERLPDRLRGSLPTVEELEAELDSRSSRG